VCGGGGRYAQRVAGKLWDNPTFWQWLVPTACYAYQLAAAALAAAPVVLPWFCRPFDALLTPPATGVATVAKGKKRVTPTSPPRTWAQRLAKGIEKMSIPSAPPRHRPGRGRNRLGSSIANIAIERHPHVSAPDVGATPPNEAPTPHGAPRRGFRRSPAHPFVLGA